MGIFGTSLIAIGLLVCGFGISWAYVDMYKQVHEYFNEDKEE